MPSEYLDQDGPFLYADQDYEFFIEGVGWRQMACSEEQCSMLAVACEGATVIVGKDPFLYADHAAILNNDNSGHRYVCAKHMPITTTKDVNDEVTAALLEHKIDPYVVADISLRLDERLNNYKPIRILNQ